MIKLDRLSDAVSAKGFSQAALAKATGVSPAAIQQIMNGKTKRTRFLREIARALDVSEAWLLGERERGQKSKFVTMQEHIVDCALINLNTPRALGFTLNAAEVVALDRRLFPAVDWEQREQMYLATGLGRQMAPTLGSDDTILFDTSRREIDQQDGVWLLLTGQLPIVRRVRSMAADRLLIVSDNPEIGSFEAGRADVGVLGAAVAYIKGVGA